MAVGLLALLATMTVAVDTMPVASRPTGDRTATPSGTSAQTERPTRSAVVTVDVDGLDRSALVVRPGGSGPHPLLIALHGAGGTPERFARETGFATAVGDAVVVYPRSSVGTWNAGGCCLEAVEARIDDVAFIRTIIEDLVADGTADPEHVFIAGFSNGGMLAHAAGCALPHLVAGVASVAGQPTAGCGADRPATVLLIQGSADPLVLIDGFESGDRRPFSYRDLSSTVDGYVAALSCHASTTGIDGAVRTQRWTSCTRGHSIHAIVIDEGTHAWPGNRLLADDLGFDATDEIVRLFRLRDDDLR